MKKFPKPLAFIILAVVVGIYAGLVMLGNFMNQLTADLPPNA